MFKFGYQAFLIFHLLSGPLFLGFLFSKRNFFLKFFLTSFFAFLSFFVFSYPFLAIPSFYGKNYQGLNGFLYFKKLYPDDYEAILWLKKSVKKQKVILEAPGKSYTHFGRVSANTGLPTILGWSTHELLWRGDTEEIQKRKKDIKEIYQTKDIQKIQKLLSKYKINYIFWGTLERKIFPSADIEKFQKIGEVVFKKGKTFIFEVSNAKN